MQKSRLRSSCADGATKVQPEKRREEKNKEMSTSLAASAAKEKKPRKRDELFDAIVKITCSDPKASASHIGRVCKWLRQAEPAYSPEEVLALPALLSARNFTLPLSLGTVEKYIGWTRNIPSGTDGFFNASNYSAFPGFIEGGKP